MAAKRGRGGAAKAGLATPKARVRKQSTRESGQSNSEWIEVARQTLIGAVPESATQLAEGAGKGSVPHIKLLLHLVGLDDGQLASRQVRPRERTLEEIFMERWNKEP